MTEALIINRPEVLQAIGCPTGDHYVLGDCFEIEGRNWHPSVKALQLARSIEDNCAMSFEVATAMHPGWPVLVLGPDSRVQVLGDVPHGYQVLAACFGIQWPKPKGKRGTS